MVPSPSTTHGPIGEYNPWPHHQAQLMAPLVSTIPDPPSATTHGPVSKHNPPIINHSSWHATTAHGPIDEYNPWPHHQTQLMALLATTVHGPTREYNPWPDQQVQPMAQSISRAFGQPYHLLALFSSFSIQQRSTYVHGLESQHFPFPDFRFWLAFKWCMHSLILWCSLRQSTPLVLHMGTQLRHYCCVATHRAAAEGNGRAPAAPPAFTWCAPLVSFFAWGSYQDTTPLNTAISKENNDFQQMTERLFTHIYISIKRMTLSLALPFCSIMHQRTLLLQAQVHAENTTSTKIERLWVMQRSLILQDLSTTWPAR